MIKIQNSLPFHSFFKLANSDVTKELYCLFIPAVSIMDHMPLVSSGVLFCDPKTRALPPSLDGFEIVKSSITLKLCNLRF